MLYASGDFQDLPRDVSVAYDCVVMNWTAASMILRTTSTSYEDLGAYSNVYPRGNKVPDSACRSPHPFVITSILSECDKVTWPEQSDA